MKNIFIKKKTMLDCFAIFNTVYYSKFRIMSADVKRQGSNDECSELYEHNIKA